MGTLYRERCSHDIDRGLVNISHVWTSYWAFCSPNNDNGDTVSSAPARPTKPKQEAYSSSCPDLRSVMVSSFRPRLEGTRVWHLD